jgi:hypothetical protein
MWPFWILGIIAVAVLLTVVAAIVVSSLEPTKPLEDFPVCKNCRHHRTSGTDLICCHPKFGKVNPITGIWNGPLCRHIRDENFNACGYDGRLYQVEPSNTTPKEGD